MILSSLAYLGIGAVTVMSLTRPARQALGADPMNYGVRFEAVTFPSRGEPDLEISAWFLPNVGSEQAVILVHGYGTGGCRTCGFNGLFGEFGARLQQRGLNVLMLDLRGHGQSDDGRYTFGLREKHDVQGAVDWLLARGFQPGQIGVLGESMGGATAIMATAEEPAVGALVIDSAFADLDDLLQTQFPKASGLPGWFLPGAYLTGYLIVGEDLRNSRPLDYMAAVAPRPVLLIHGTMDESVPFYQLQWLADAYGGAPTWVVEGATHVNAYHDHPEDYLDRVAGFFTANLAP